LELLKIMENSRGKSKVTRIFHLFDISGVQWMHSLVK
jgi:hypothetical protein